MEILKTVFEDMCIVAIGGLGWSLFGLLISIVIGILAALLAIKK